MGMLGAWLLWQTWDTVIGYLLVVSAHHAGHHLLGRRGGLSTVGVDLHALGGTGHHSGEAPRLRYVLARSGGVLGQMALLWLAIIVTSLLSASTDSDIYRALTTINLGIMALNLLPIDGADGESVWKLPGALLARLEEKLTYLQLQEVEEQKAGWKAMIDRDQDAVPIPRVPKAPVPDLAAMLAEQDALADAGITDDLAAEVSSLLAGVWGGGEE